MAAKRSTSKAKKKYRYDGPITSVTLGDSGGEYILFPGRTYDMPTDSQWVQSLVARKYLTAVDAATTK